MNHARRFQFLFNIYLGYRSRCTCVCNYYLCSLLVSRGLGAPNGRGPRFLEPAEPAIATPLGRGSILIKNSVTYFMDGFISAPSTLASCQFFSNIQRANPAMAPHRSWQWSLAPSGGRNSNGRIVNLCKCKDFGFPLIDVGYGFAPPTENQHIKTQKQSMTKNLK